MSLVVHNRQRVKALHLPRLRAVARALLACAGAESAELGIHLVAAPEMTRLNATYLRHAGSTDVITFDHGPLPAPPGGQPPALHGELFVCVDEAVSQARRFRSTWQSEIVRYIVHGVLHLAGHDDQSAVRRRRMKREENRLVRLLARKYSFAQLSRAAKLRA